MVPKLETEKVYVHGGPKIPVLAGLNEPKPPPCNTNPGTHRWKKDPSKYPACANRMKFCTVLGFSWSNSSRSISPRPVNIWTRLPAFEEAKVQSNEMKQRQNRRFNIVLQHTGLGRRINYSGTRSSVRSKPLLAIIRYAWSPAIAWRQTSPPA